MLKVILFAVPWEAGVDAIVTVSMGIFPQDGGLEAPAAVVGFQMPMKALFDRFIDITSKTPNADFNCTFQWIDCFLIDQNGYVVISEAHNDTGQFLGTLEGPVMNSLVKQGIFTAVEIYDYQALCEFIVSVSLIVLKTIFIGLIIEQKNQWVQKRWTSLESPKDVFCPSIQVFLLPWSLETSHVIKTSFRQNTSRRQQKAYFWNPNPRES